MKPHSKLTINWFYFTGLNVIIYFDEKNIVSYWDYIGKTPMNRRDNSSVDVQLKIL